jgi:hypothetical protein
MSWCNDAPPRFTLYYEAALGRTPRQADWRRKLVADSLDDA